MSEKVAAMLAPVAGVVIEEGLRALGTVHAPTVGAITLIK